MKWQPVGEHDDHWFILKNNNGYIIAELIGGRNNCYFSTNVPQTYAYCLMDDMETITQEQYWFYRKNPDVVLMEQLL